MRPALIATTLMLTACLAACGADKGNAGPERRSAAGEVLGGEVSDAMIPLDTVRSTAPAAPPASPATSGTPRTNEDRRAVLPQPEVSGGPEPLPIDAVPDDAPSPPQP